MGLYLVALVINLTVAQAPLTAVVASQPSLTFHWQNHHLLATVDRSLLGTDFVVRAQVVSDIPMLGETTSPDALSEAGQGAGLVSGALQLRQEGDSLVLLEYVGWAEGRLRYRRRAATAIHYTVPGGRALVVNAAPLWAALEPAERGSADRAVSMDLSTLDIAHTRHVSVSRPPARSHEQTTVAWPFGARTVYAVDVLRLPKVPMRPRLSDPRVGFTAVKAKDSTPQATPGRSYVSRHRLEKKNPAASVSEVVRPIVFRITESVPKRWIPFVKRAAESWNPVFEAIGFRGAILVRLPSDAPPDTSQPEIPIHWKISSGGQGGRVQGGTTSLNPDPRSGELLSTDVMLTDVGLDRLQMLYFQKLGMYDRAARFPFPDSVTGKILEIIARHEVGHALGLDHNFKNNGYPTDSLRRPSFFRRLGGPLPTTMGYTWFNYVAQPDDKVPVNDLLANIGPYDRWTIAWGYRPISGADTPEAELATLEQWRTAQDTASYLRMSVGGDPHEQIGVLGDDLLKSAEYGIQNLGRLTDIMLRDSVMLNDSTIPHWRRLIVGDWSNILTPLVGIIGGVVPEAPYARDRAKVARKPMDPAYQLQALRFVLSHTVYGQDPVIQRILGKPVPGKTSPILFEQLAPEWEISQKTWRRPLRVIQQETLANFFEKGRLSAFAAQVAPNRPRLPADLCKDMRALDQQLAAVTDAPARQQQAKLLREIVAPVVDPAANLCD